MMTQAQFLAAVEQYLRDSGTSATNLGKEIGGDPNFVFDLRKGRSPSLKTVERAMKYMAGNTSAAEPERLAS
jgi:homoserine dehydrogenase